MSETPREPQAPQSPELTKIAIDLAPLLIFFVTYMTAGIYWATGALMASTVVSIVASRILLAHVSGTLIFSTALVVGFGALTFWFNDPSFIKMKPTIIYLLFAALLFGGLVFGKPMLRYVLGQALRLPDQAWSVLSLRWGVFFVVLAALNELIWRTQSEAFWATFKVFGFLPLTILFFATQFSFIQHHQMTETDTTDKSAR